MVISVIKDGVVVNRVTVPDDWTGGEGEWQAPNGCTVERDGPPVGAVRKSDKWEVPVVNKEPARNLAAEVDQLRAELAALKETGKSPLPAGDLVRG